MNALVKRLYAGSVVEFKSLKLAPKAVSPQPLPAESNAPCSSGTPEGSPALHACSTGASTNLSMEGLSMLTTMSDAERRTLVTAQIAAALVADRNLTSETP